MSAAVGYSVSILTGYNNETPDPRTAHGVLYHNSTTVAWPTELTSVSITGLTQQAGSVTRIIIPFTGPDNTKTGSITLGQFLIGTPVPWPSTLAGVLVNTQNLQPPTPAPTTRSSQTATNAAPNVATEQGSDTQPVTSSASFTDVPPSSSTGLPGSDTSTSTGHSGLSAGATAGIAIGCAIVGIAIGLIAACLLFRHKGKRSNGTVHQVQTYEPDAKGYSEKHNKETLVSKPSRNQKQQQHQLNLNQYLLEATPDREIVHEVQALGALVDQHTEGYYHSNSITVDGGALASSLMRLGLEPRDAQLTTDLCLDPRTRRDGVRHAITRVLFGSIDMRSPQYATMLPVAVRAFLQSTPSVDSDSCGNAQAYSMALRKWRTVSAYLLHPARSQRTTLPVGDSAVVEHQAQEVAEALNGGFLRFFTFPGQQAQQAGHLQAMFVECAKLGCTLFSHPSDWEFVYEATGSKKTSKMQGVPTRGVVVVEAGLNKLTDRDEAPFVSRQTIVEPVVVQY